MIYHEEKVRVRYAETDKMGYVYYGNYANYLEVARVELIRSLGISYRKMEEDGIMLPIASYNSKFIKPGFYDDVLTIKTTVKDKPGVKIKFDYEIVNEQGQLLTIADTTLVFIDMKTSKPCRPPQVFEEALTSYFS
ncbi:MAG: acyl-CoA thioesterase [Cyclobacteriaceae bacterium]